MTLTGKQSVRAKQSDKHWREWARTLPLLFALPAFFLIVGLLIRACGPTTEVPQGVPDRPAVTGINWLAHGPVSVIRES
jgi:hypothetical protein